MDSMRNLHSSLPRSSSRRRKGQPSAELLQAFKAAALSVTQLYKTAAGDEDSHHHDGHAAGYQDALDDLLDFLDHENLGLGDGEGWQVRQWATQRLAASPPAGKSGRDASGGAVSGESDDDNTTSRARSASPLLTSKQKTPLASMPPAQPASSAATDSPAAPDTHHHAPSESRPDIFQFRSNTAMPPFDADAMQTTADRRRSPSAVRLEVLPPHARASRRQGALGHGAGSKRKIQMSDFFDISGISGIGDKRDGFGGGSNGTGGGKRGRFA